MAFADNIKQLPPVAHLAELQLLDAAGKLVAAIENKPGKSGSLTLSLPSLVSSTHRPPNAGWPCLPNTRHRPVPTPAATPTWTVSSTSSTQVRHWRSS